jgi:hypothetical protein
MPDPEARVVLAASSLAIALLAATSSDGAAKNTGHVFVSTMGHRHQRWRPAMSLSRIVSLSGPSRSALLAGF